LSPLALSLRFLQTQSDAQLASLARAGHERAFEALVRRYRRPLLAYCRRVGSSGVNPEDTLQQALLQAWSAIRTGVDVRDPRAWLYRIVHNVAVSNQRRPALVPVELQDTAGANGADFEAEQRMAARAALAGLAALPHLQREVMVGTAVDGLSHEELASALGLSSGAVRGLIYRARATLRAAAAAVIPAPVIGWALRSGSGRASGVYEALGGGGSAGLGGILLKGGAIAATAGAIATAGISSNQPSGHRHATDSSVAGVQHAARQQASAAAASAVLVDDPTRASSLTVGERLGGGSQDAESRETSDRGDDRSSAGFVTKPGSDGGRDGATSGGAEHHDGSGNNANSGPGPSGGSNSGSGDRGPGGGSSGDGGGLTTSSGGHGSDDPAGDVPGSDGGSRGGSGSSGSGSSGSGSSGSGSGSSGSGSSGSGSSGSGSSGSGGSGSDGSGGGDSATAPSTPATTATPDDGSDKSGHDDGSTTSTTTTVATTTAPTTVDDDGGSGHHRGKG
jgi:RNA polymerase sigma factor (sigma-70 family)